MVIFQTIFPPGDADMPGFGGFDQFDLGLKEGVPDVNARKAASRGVPPLPTFAKQLDIQLHYFRSYSSRCT